MWQKLIYLMLIPLMVMQLTACDPQHNDRAEKETRPWQCLAQQSHCQFDLAGGQVQVLFDVEKIVAEQSSNMVINIHGAESIKTISGYLEGTDMYMGKIPVFIEPRFSNASGEKQAKAGKNQPLEKIAPLKQVFQAEVLVGSCSAQQMTWRLWLTFTTQENKTYSKMLTVVSYRS